MKSLPCFSLQTERHVGRVCVGERIQLVLLSTKILSNLIRSRFIIPVSAQVKKRKKQICVELSPPRTTSFCVLSLKCIGAGAGGVALCCNVVKNDDSFFFWPIYCTPVAHILAVGLMINRIPPISPFCVSAR